jgi:flagellar basal body-associated protein FliL
MNSDFRAVLIALIIVIVIFAMGMGGHFLFVSNHCTTSNDLLA